MITKPEIVVIVVAFLAIVFLRSFLGTFIRLVFFLIFVAIAAAGVTMIMNNETIWEKPGFPQRVARFVTMNSAAASTTGSGSVTCDPNSPPPTETAAAQAAPRKHAKREAEPEPKNTRNEPGAGPAPTDDVFPELILRGYPGLSREKLFQLSQDTVGSLGGWKIVKADSGSFTLNCIYTSRLLKFEDDVRIAVQPSGDIDVCSRSGLARPDATSMLRYFPGDLGANIGHIKQFYETLEPKMDEVYKEEQDKQNAKNPPH
jgi:hypothetical protein